MSEEDQAQTVEEVVKSLHVDPENMEEVDPNETTDEEEAEDPQVEG